jgi:hypothetical protein
VLHIEVIGNTDRFLTSAVDGGEWSVSRPGHALPLGKDPWYGSWVGLRAALDTSLEDISFSSARD